MKTGPSNYHKLSLPTAALHRLRAEYHMTGKIRTEPTHNITVTKEDTKPHSHPELPKCFLQNVWCGDVLVWTSDSQHGGRR